MAKSAVIADAPFSSQKHICSEVIFLTLENGETEGEPLHFRLSFHSVRRGVSKSVLTHSLKFPCSHRLGAGLKKAASYIVLL